MKLLKNLILAATFTAVCAVTLSHAENNPTHIFAKVDHLEFQPLRGGPIEIAVVWGNPSEGPSSAYLKFPANFPLGMHSHSSNYHGVVVQGTTKHWIDGNTEADAPLLKAGDYFYQGAGEMHEDSYPSDVDVIVFLHFDGPIDFLPKQ